MSEHIQPRSESWRAAVIRRLRTWTRRPIEQPTRGEWPVATVVILAALILMTLRIGSQRIDPDELAHLHSAWLWLQGLEPYIDFFEHHPPFYWLLLRPVVSWFSEGNLHSAVVAARILTLATVVLTVLATYSAAGELLGSRRAGLFSAAAWALFCCLSNRMIHARPDQLMLLLLVYGTYLAARGLGFCKKRLPSPVTAAVGGFVLGAAVCVLQKGLFWVLPFGLSAAVAPLICRDRYGRPRLRALICFVSGGLAAGALMVGWITVFSDWQAFWYGNVSRNVPVIGRLTRGGKWWLVLTKGPFVWPMPSAVVSAIGAVLLLLHNRATRTVTIFAGIAGSSALVVFALFAWQQYQFPLLWWMSLLGGFAFAGITARLNGYWTAACALLAVLPVAIALNLYFPRLHDSRNSLSASLSPYQAVLDRVKLGDTMIALSHRNPVFVMSAVPLLWMTRMLEPSVERDREFVEAIVRRRPRFVILANYRALRTDVAPIGRLYYRLNEFVLEKR